MNPKFTFGRFELAVSPGQAAASAPRDEESLFHLVVMADFTGRTSRGVLERLDGHRAWTVDCDNFDTVLHRLGPRLRVATPGQPASELRFETLDDFHPDRLLKQSPPLAKLIEQRQRLLNPATAQAAAAELSGLLASAAPANTPASAATAPSKPAESDADTLTRLLGGAPAPTAGAPAPTAGGVDRLIRHIVAPSIVPAATAQETAALTVLDLDLSSQLRALLHHPHFQALEAAWRGLDLLVRTFGGEDNFKLHVLDISQAELAADLAGSQSLEMSGWWRLLQRQIDEQKPWAACLGLYTFETTLGDLELLGRLAKVAAAAGLVFMAGASPGFAGADSFAAQPDPDGWKQLLPTEVLEAWRAARDLPEAQSVALALPRFLLRQPYGKQSDPIDAFPFEELPADTSHEAYLWGNPAIACGHILARAFLAEGWALTSIGGELEELPLHKFKQDCEIQVKPCAEVWLSERAGEAIRRQGLTPLFSVKGRNEVRVPWILSLRGAPLTLH